MNFVRLCEVVGPLVLCIWLYNVYYVFYPGQSTFFWLLNWVMTFSHFLLLLIICDIYRLKPYGLMTFKVLIYKYFLILFARFGLIACVRTYKASKNIKNQQEHFLKDILSKRQDTEYGQRFKFSDIESVAQFRETHPVTTYEHFQHYMERCVGGQKNVLTNDEIMFIGMTSGTTGKNKVYPIFKSMGKVYMDVFSAAMQYLAMKYPDVYSLRSTVSTRVPKKLKEMNGMKYGPVSAMSQDSTFNYINTTPCKETNEIYDEHLMMYIHAVFGLRDREVLKLETGFVSLARSFFRCLETNWEEICDDIEHGTLKNVELEEATKKSLESLLSPDPERADDLRREFRKGFHDILPRVWPHIGYVAMLTSGPLACQAKALQRRYYSNIPVLSTIHLSTESVYGINMSPGNVDPNVYTLIVTGNFFEFIPLEKAQDPQPETLLIDELEVGKEYEIVVTNEFGLYRYRSGDVIKIVSYYNQIPQYQFQFRLGQMLNVFGERTTEASVQTAVEHLVTDLPGAELVDYTSVENSSVDEIPELKDENKLRYYVVFIEVDGGYQLTDDDKVKFDEYLCQQNEWYSANRKEGRIDTVSLHQVQSETFIQLKQRILDQNYGAASAQFKMPRVQRNADHLRFLAEKRLNA